MSKFGYSKEVVEDFMYLAGNDAVDCSKCENLRVILTGSYEYDEEGFYVGYICPKCGHESHCGDSHFQVYIAKFDIDKKIFIDVEEE